MAEPDEGEGDEHSTMGTALMAFHATLRSNESVVLTLTLTLTLALSLSLSLSLSLTLSLALTRIR